jgi:VWFA-related protein
MIKLWLRRFWTLLSTALIAAASFLVAAGQSQQPPTQAPAAQGQPSQAQPESASSIPVIMAETKLVLVDTIVTDKKGTYIHDLAAKNFKVFEDNKEQPVKSFSVEANGAAPSDNRRHYLVLFFDNSTMQLSDQMQARQAATKFVEANAGPDRYIAIVDFGGTVRIAQNFTADAKRLQQAVKDLKFSSVSPNAEPVQLATLGVPSLYNVEADFGARTLLLALRDVARSMASVPGRKSLVLLTAGFPMEPSDPATPQRQSELTAVINECNKANVSIYPIDVRGLVVGKNSDKPLESSPEFELADESNEGRLATAVLKIPDPSRSDGDENAWPRLVYVQRTGGRGGTGGGAGGHVGGTGGSGGRTGGVGGRTGGGSSPTYNPYNSYLYNQSRQIVPPIPALASTNQQVLYQMAEGTGGFVIVNSNDLLGGMQKIAHDQGEYYILGYTPPASEEGSCHTLKVKVDRSETVVRSRSGYCNVRPADLLAGKPAEKQLENRAGGAQAGNIAASMRAPYFYVSPNVARVNLAMEIPPSAFKFEKEKGKLHSAMDVLGLAYTPDGAVAARFSDTVNLDFDDKKQVEEFNKKAFRYENEFDIAAGSYKLKVVFSSGGDSFGKLESPIIIGPYNGKQFTMSDVALSKDLRPLAQVSANLDATLLENRTPLVAQGVQIMPSGTDQFKKTDTAILYVEVYDPLLVGANPPKVGVQYRVVDRKSGEKKVDVTGGAAEAKAGNPVVPVGLKIPVDSLPPGSYRIELKAMDTAGNSSPQRTADFEVQ